MKNIDNPSEKIIIALDGMDKNHVFTLLEKIPEIVWVKVGLELFVSEGPEVLSILRDKGKKIFLDLKFHDIPTTCLLYTSPSPRDQRGSRMPSSA